MRQWDIHLFPFTEELPHPVVILSTDERSAARQPADRMLSTADLLMLPTDLLRLPLFSQRTCGRAGFDLKNRNAFLFFKSC